MTATVEVRGQVSTVASGDLGAETFRAYLVTSSRERPCRHKVGHRSAEAAQACGDRMLRAAIRARSG